ncbi:hypothetical protein OsI_25176 [Oryza sativa Indica Group]|uniref:Uncharacterized protein n=1 Tax=Oryza sativa subsp. indica TaxID=39946 RepID=B8B7X4_ORYSI|nr:hypothetical protein OsI_25176 [Oryza sativa Indica Group]
MASSSSPAISGSSPKMPNTTGINPSRRAGGRSAAVGAAEPRPGGAAPLALATRLRRLQRRMLLRLLREPDQAERSRGRASSSSSASRPQPRAAATATSSGNKALDIEAAAAGDHQVARDDDDDDADAKRVSKSVQTVSLFAASASLLLFANLTAAGKAPTTTPPPPRLPAGGALYSVNLALICLGLLTSLALSIFSILAPAARKLAVTKVQKRGMVMAVAFVLVSFLLRISMMLPAASLEWVFLLIFLVFACAEAAYLSLVYTRHVVDEPKAHICAINRSGTRPIKLTLRCVLLTEADTNRVNPIG